MKIKRARLVGAAVLTVGAVLATMAGGTAMANNGLRTLQGRLSGYQEDPLVISTDGGGRFQMQVNSRSDSATYRLSYSELEGDIAQAHIHLGGRAQSGGIVVFLCSNLGNGPEGTQTCPADPAEITGTIEADDVLALANQGMPAGAFDEFIAAVRAGVTYVNVHTSTYPGGEIRAQVEHFHHR